MKRLINGLAIAALVLIVGACSSNPKSTTTAPTTTVAPTTTTLETHTLTGSLTYPGFYAANYKDIDEGVPVNVTDEHGTLLGTSSLGPVQITKDYGHFQFDFTVTDLPAAKFYRIKVGSRSEMSYSYDQMQSAGWNVKLTLG